jgi:hypothetical protein
MWGAALMIALEVHREIRPYEKSAHLLVFSSAKKVFFAEFRQTLRNVWRLIFIKLYKSLLKNVLF